MFRKQFIDDVEANAVVRDLQYYGIIPQGCQEQISNTSGRKLRNQILHEQLVANCTNQALINACNIFIVEEGYPKMKALGEAMKKSLEAGAFVCASVYTCVFMCKHVCVMLRPYRVLYCLSCCDSRSHSQRTDKLIQRLTHLTTHFTYYDMCSHYT